MKQFWFDIKPYFKPSFNLIYVSFPFLFIVAQFVHVTMRISNFIIARTGADAYTGVIFVMEYQIARKFNTIN